MKRPRLTWSTELEAWATDGKPIIITEYGADTVEIRGQVKGVLTDLGFDSAVKAQQIFGGHGYIEEWGMSQFVRDARIAMIYEGANGIQALDLVGRKLPKDGGRALQAFFAEVQGFLKEQGADAVAGTPVVGRSRRARGCHGAFHNTSVT